MGDFSVQEFNAEDFQFEHEDRLNERNGQWLDENMNTSLWLSQGCYVSGKCIVEGEKLEVDGIQKKSLVFHWPLIQ